jgi:hypothetical protein
VSADPDTCPRCKANLQGLPIDETHHYSRAIGVEIPNVYDGILYWMCPECSWAWQRWPEGTVRASAAGDRIAEHNEDLPEWTP